MLEKLLKHLPPSFAGYFILFGPAVILAVEGSGKTGISEILPSGMNHGYAMFALIVAVLLFKYAFAAGIARYTVAKGENIFIGLKKIPGPKNWEVIFISLIYVIEMIGYGSIALIGSLFLCSLLPAPAPYLEIALGTIVVVVLLLMKGSYERFEHVMLLMAALLIAGTAYTILFTPTAYIPHDMPLSFDDPTLLEMMALIGAVGSGLNILLYSVWLHEKIGDSHGPAFFQSHMKSITLDLVIGFALMGLFAVFYLALGDISAPAQMHHDPTGTRAIIGVLEFMSRIPYGLTVFGILGFFCLFGAIFSSFDGRARAIASLLHSSERISLGETTLYRLILIGFAVIAGCAIGLGRPLQIIEYVAASASIMFALLGFMMIYLDRQLPVFARGSRLWVATMAIGSAFFLCVALLLEQNLLLYGLPLILNLGFVVIAAYVVQKYVILQYISSDRLKTTVWIAFIFGLLSIVGTTSGTEFDGAIVNFRDLGPMIAGILGGPVAGGIAGIIGGAYRYSLGGWTALPCSVATTVAGLFAGYCSIRWRGDWSYLRLVLLAIIVECIHLLVIVPLLLAGTSPEEVLLLIRVTLLPMIAANSVGLVLFFYILRDRQPEQATARDENQACFRSA